MSEATVRQVIAIVVGPRRGGVRRLADTLGLAHSTVRTWTAAGRIPAKWQPVLLQLAAERGVPLEPKHFFYLDTDLPPPPPPAHPEANEQPRAAA